MLIYFRVSNSRSIGKELEFSAIATDDVNVPENTIEMSKYGIRLLKTMALFGANASGKSNILKAIADAWNIICKPEFDKKEIHFPYNRSDANNIKSLISYKFTFLIDNTVYNYSFSHDRTRIIEEVLTENIDANRNKEIYSRKFDIKTKKYQWQPESFFTKKNTEFFRLSTAEHKLFLTIANNPANPDAVERHILLDKIYHWFNKQLIYAINISNPGKIGYDYFISFVLKSEKNKQLILNQLKKINIPIENIKIFEVSGSKLENDNKFSIYPYNQPDTDVKTVVAVIIKTYHKVVANQKQKSGVEDFDFFKEESHGTQQFLAWIGLWLYQFQQSEKSKIFVIDELGTSLHPKLTLFLMKLFSNKDTNPYNSQLIFTTHEVKLMDKSIMRPDQLYLVNKDNVGNTTIERASDYADIEKYSRLDTLYMSGGMSGIPTINL